MQQRAGIDHLSKLLELEKCESAGFLDPPVHRLRAYPLLSHVLQRDILSRCQNHFLDDAPYRPFLPGRLTDFLIGIPAVIGVQLERLVLDHVKTLKSRFLCLTKKAAHQRLHLFLLFPGKSHHGLRIVHQPGIGVLRVLLPAHIHKKPDVEPDHRHIELFLHRFHMVEVVGIHAEQTARHRVVGISVYRYGALSGQHIEYLHTLVEIRIGGPVDDSALDPDLLLHIVVVMVDPRVPVILLFHNFYNLTLYDSSDR